MFSKSEPIQQKSLYDHISTMRRIPKVHQVQNHYQPYQSFVRKTRVVFGGNSRIPATRFNARHDSIVKIFKLRRKKLMKTSLCFLLSEVVQTIVNPFHATVIFLYPLIISDKQRFSEVFRGYRNRTMTQNGLRIKSDLEVKGKSSISKNHFSSTYDP